MGARSSVAVKFTGDTADLKRAIDTLDGKMRGLGSRMASVGKMAALGIGATVVAVVAGAKSAIDAGSDLNEVISKSNTVFKDQGAAMLDWAKDSATAFGQSKKEALDAASAFGNMFIQLGIGRTESAAMSRQMTELASDFASFHNADISEVLIAQQAAFRGEYDAVQRFVPTINAAAVEQKALKMGLAKTTKELTAQDKALATQTLLLEGAGDAMGDFARTSDGMANKQRILAARFDDVKAKIGQGLIPVALALAGFLSDRVIPVFEEVAGGVMAMVGGFQHAEDGITSSGFAGVLEGIGIWANGAAKNVKRFVEDSLEALGKWWDENGETIIDLAEDIGKTIETAFDLAGDAWENVLKPAFDAITDWFTDSPGRMQWLAATIGGTLVLAFGAWAVAATAAAVASLSTVWPLVLIAGFAFAAGGATQWLIDKFNLMPKAAGLMQIGIDNIITPLHRLNETLARAVGLLDQYQRLVGNIFALGESIGGVHEADPSIVTDLFPQETKQSAKGNAQGTPNWRGGLTWVGEHGRELLSLPGGSRITSHGRSMAMVGGGGTQVIQLVVDGQVLAQVVADAERRDSRNRGDR